MITFVDVLNNINLLDGFSSVDLVEMSCMNCGNAFKQRKKDVKQAITRGYSGMFCSPKCTTLRRAKGHSSKIPCAQCGCVVHATIARTRNSKSGNVFCSISCSVKYNNLHRTISNKRSSRSLAEDYMLDLIRTTFPSVHVESNTRSPLTGQLEIDIWLPEISLAIELNGPMHYFPIHGDAKLTIIQSNDFKKQQALVAAGIRLLIIDISTLKSTKKSLVFLDSHFESKMKPIIESLFNSECCES